ncbi:hypothetical protein GCM10007978_25440 [Shewanella hanedai]|nr:hypothetical protein GCM10007978_25440 [Shewanella hanedai]
MKIKNTAELKSQFGVAGTSHLQVVGGPICNGVMVVLITF